MRLAVPGFSAGDSYTHISGTAQLAGGSERYTAYKSFY